MLSSLAVQNTCQSGSNAPYIMWSRVELEIQRCNLKELLTSTADLLKTPISIFNRLSHMHTNMIRTCVHSPITVIVQPDTHSQEYTHTHTWPGVQKEERATVVTPCF